MRFVNIHRGQPKPPGLRRRDDDDEIDLGFKNEAGDDSDNESGDDNDGLRKSATRDPETVFVTVPPPAVQAGQTINPINPNVVLVPPARVTAPVVAAPPTLQSEASIRTLTAIVPPAQRTTLSEVVRSTSKTSSRTTIKTLVTETALPVNPVRESAGVRQGAYSTIDNDDVNYSETMYEKGMEETAAAISSARPTATTYAGSSLVSSGMDRGVVIGLASGMAGLGAILILGLVFFLRWRRKIARPGTGTTRVMVSKPILPPSPPAAMASVSDPVTAPAAAAGRPLTTQSELMNRAMRAVYRVEAGGRLSASTNATSIPPPPRSRGQGEDPFRDQASQLGSDDRDKDRESGYSSPRWEDREFTLPPSGEPSIVSMYASDDPARRQQQPRRDRTPTLSQVSFPSGAGDPSGWRSPTQSERDRTRESAWQAQQQSRWSESTSQGLDRTISLDFGRDSEVPPVPRVPLDDPPRGRTPRRPGSEF